jgi:hypothetical protein
MALVAFAHVLSGSSVVNTNPPHETPPPPAAEEARPVGEDWGANPVFVRSLDAFYRDLPELLKKHCRKWVAYHGDECLGFARTETELYERSLRNGLKMGQFAVMYVHHGAMLDRDEAYWDEIDAGPPPR